MPAGRPTDYSEEILAKARDYLANYTEAIPTVAGLSLHLGISRETIYDWASQEEKKEFSDIVGECKSKQEIKLIDKGLKGEFNPTIAKLILSGKHGYVEKSEVDQNIKGDVKFVNDVPRPTSE